MRTTIENGKRVILVPKVTIINGKRVIIGLPYKAVIQDGKRVLVRC